jgi:hypothetical protein
MGASTRTPGRGAGIPGFCADRLSGRRDTQQRSRERDVAHRCLPSALGGDYASAPPRSVLGKLSRKPFVN